MTEDSLAFSFVISTFGRRQELIFLLESIERQSVSDFEVIVVDQNEDDRLANSLKDRRWSFPLTHVRSPYPRGVCRGRNLGWRQARGRILIFPDDDCWYPPWLLARVNERFIIDLRAIGRNQEKWAPVCPSSMHRAG